MRNKLETIFTASCKLSKTVEDLLELMRLDAVGVKLNYAWFDLRSYLENLTQFYCSAVSSSSIQIELKLPSYEINVFTDKAKLEQILNNLISNAIKYVDPGKGLIKIGLQDYEEKVKIYIADNGRGIPPDQLEAIFERYRRIEKEGASFTRGSGIGLAFARQLAGYLKAKLWAESEGEGKGSIFFLEMLKQPIAPEADLIVDKINKPIMPEPVISNVDLNKDFVQAEIELDLPNPNRENEFLVKKALILIVDDDREAVKIIKEYCQRKGFINFILTFDGKSGLEAVYNYKPDLIICDYNLPGIRGDKFHNELTSHFALRKIPFIFLTAITDQGIKLERRRKGAVAFLSKPIDENELIFTVENSLKSYMEIKALAKKAEFDTLTGCNNKRTLLNNLFALICGSDLRELVLVFIDIDNFKQINDNLGHQAGDFVLKQFGQLLKNSLRQTDLVARFGGDEFVVLLPDTNQKETLQILAKIIKKIEAKKMAWENKTLKFSFSAGVTGLLENQKLLAKKLGCNDLSYIYSTKTDSPILKNKKRLKQKLADYLLDLADKALYQAKATTCQNYFFSSVKELDFINSCCPRCGSCALEKGRNRIISLKEDLKA